MHWIDSTADEADHIAPAIVTLLRAIGEKSKAAEGEPMVGRHIDHERSNPNAEETPPTAD